MKQVTFAVGLLVLGLTVGLVIPGVFAQAPQAEVQKWEGFCEIPKQHGSLQKGIAKANVSVAAQGEKGYQLVSGTTFDNAGALVLCYRRPAR